MSHQSRATSDRMKRFPSAIVLALALIGVADSALAQVGSADITALSVLRMAQAEAEKVAPEEQRTHVRALVARTMLRTGHRETFADYIRDVLKVDSDARHQPKGDELDRFNFDIELKAKQSVLLGDDESAKQYLKRCRIERWPPPPCSSGELMVTQETFYTMRFLAWEVEEQRLDAAMRRLKTAPWDPDIWLIVIARTGASIAAGNPEVLKEIQRLFRRAGGEIYTCTMTMPVRPGMFATRSPLQPYAELRKKACEGDPRGALDTALAVKDVTQRAYMLGAVAEGLAQIPGSPLD
jgi:hypothetical protein